MSEFALTAPIVNARGEKVDVLTLHEITTRDVIRFGEPVTLRQNAQGVPELDDIPDRIAGYVQSMTRLTPPEMNQLDIADIMRLNEQVRLFFVLKLRGVEVASSDKSDRPQPN